MRFMHIVNTDRNPVGLQKGILFCLCFFLIWMWCRVLLKQQQMFENGNHIWDKLFGMLQILPSFPVLTPLHSQKGRSLSFAHLISVFNFRRLWCWETNILEGTLCMLKTAVVDRRIGKTLSCFHVGLVSQNRFTGAPQTMLQARHWGTEMMVMAISHRWHKKYLGFVACMRFHGT